MAEFSSESTPKLVVQRAHNIEVGRKPCHDPRHPDHKVFRIWQHRGWEALCDSSLRTLVAPTGSGKSILVKALAWKDAAQLGHKVIIAVPQTIIARSFCDRDRIETPEGSLINWAPNHLLFGGYSRSAFGYVSKLQRFLRAPVHPTVNKRILVCSQQTLVFAAKQLRESGEENLWQGVSLYIDECHHSRSPQLIKELKEDQIRNCLGQLIAHYVEKDPGPLMMATATFARWDSLSIIPPEHLPRFQRFVYGFDEYLESMEHLRRIDIRYFVGDPVQTIKQAAQEDPTSPTIVYIPSPQSLDTSGTNKLAFIRQLQEALGVPRYNCNAVHHTLPSGQEVTSLDLVNPKNRDDRKEWLYEVIGTREVPNWIWAMYLGREGFDMPELQRSFVIGVRHTIMLLQMLGRLTRDYPGKDRIEFNIVLPHFESDDTPQQIVAHLKSMMMATILEWQLVPMRLHLKLVPKKHRKAAREAIEKARDPVVAQQITDRIIDEAVARGDNVTPDFILDAVLEGMGFNEPVRHPIRSSLSEALRRVTRAVIQPEEVEYSVPIQQDVLGCVRRYTAGLTHLSLKELKASLTQTHPHLFSKEEIERAFFEAARRLNEDGDEHPS